MLFANLSSHAFLDAPAAPTPEMVDKLAALSLDEPLPPTYRRDNIRLLAQSPRKVYLYWDLAGDPFAVLPEAFGPQSAVGYRLMTRLVNLATEEEFWEVAAAARMQSFAVQPDQEYRAEIGLFAPGRAFIRLLSSDAVRTPRAGVAPQPAAEPEFYVAADDFARVLDEAGYAGDALEVALEAADAAHEEHLSHSLAQQFSGAVLPELNRREQSELRGLLAALATGHAPATLDGILSHKLAEWLAQAQTQSALSNERLLDVLRAMMGVALAGSGYDADAARRTTRFNFGGSQVNLPATAYRLWLPSLTTGAAGRMKAEG